MGQRNSTPLAERQFGSYCHVAHALAQNKMPYTHTHTPTDAPAGRLKHSQMESGGYIFGVFLTSAPSYSTTSMSAVIFVVLFFLCAMKHSHPPPPAKLSVFRLCFDRSIGPAVFGAFEVPQRADGPWPEKRPRRYFKEGLTSNTEKKLVIGRAERIHFPVIKGERGANLDAFPVYPWPRVDITVVSCVFRCTLPKSEGVRSRLKGGEVT